MCGVRETLFELEHSKTILGEHCLNMFPFKLWQHKLEQLRQACEHPIHVFFSFTVVFILFVFFSTKGGML